MNMYVCVRGVCCVRLHVCLNVRLCLPLAALGHPHTFFCRLELGSDREVPASLQSHLEVEFDMPAASASKATVRSLSVEDRADAKKWINYKSHYSYQVIDQGVCAWSCSLL